MGTDIKMVVFVFLEALLMSVSEDRYGAEILDMGKYGILLEYCRDDAYSIQLDDGNTILETTDGPFDESTIVAPDPKTESIVEFDSSNQNIIQDDNAVSENSPEEESDQQEDSGIVDGSEIIGCEDFMDPVKSVPKI